MGARFSVLFRFWKFLRRLFGLPETNSDPEQANEGTPLNHGNTSSDPDSQLAAPPPECNRRNEDCIVQDEDNPLIASLNIPPHQRVGSTSSCSGDESDDQLTSAKAQLRSIPDPAEPLRIEYHEHSPEEPPKRPIQLSELIQSVLPRTLFYHLQIKDVLATGKVNHHLKGMVDNYFLHYVLPRSKIYYYIDHVVEDGSPPSEEYQCLYPVIRRIDKQKRVFPDDRVVFEPEIEGKPRYTYRTNSFNHLEIKFHLGDGGWPKNWPLDCPPAARTPYSYRADGYRKRRKLPYTRMYHFMRFDTFKDSPIYVFYKDLPNSDRNKVTLHAISIPLNFLRQSLCATQ